jgi:hypothetical protein
MPSARSRAACTRLMALTHRLACSLRRSDATLVEGGSDRATVLAESLPRDMLAARYACREICLPRDMLAGYTPRMLAARAHAARTLARPPLSSTARVRAAPGRAMRDVIARARCPAGRESEASTRLPFGRPPLRRSPLARSLLARLPLRRPPLGPLPLICISVACVLPVSCLQQCTHPL